MLPVPIFIVALSTALIGIMLWFKSRLPESARRKSPALALVGMLLMIFSVLLKENPVLHYIVMGIGVGIAAGSLVLTLVKSN